MPKEFSLAKNDVVCVDSQTIGPFRMKFKCL